jgi:hypothetical protein
MISLATWILWVHILAAGLWMGGAAVILATLGPAGTLAVGLLRRAQFVTSRAMEVLVLTGLLNVLVKGAGTEFAFQAGFFAMLALKMGFLACMAGLQIWMVLALRRGGSDVVGLIRRARLGLGLQLVLGAVASLLGLGLRAV